MSRTRLHHIKRFAALLAWFSQAALPAAAADKALPVVPTALPEPAADGTLYLPGTDGKPHATTIDAKLQAHLTEFLIDSDSPIAGVIVVDVATGSVLALAQGRKPETWGGRAHTALHPSFPAASVFKTVVTTAAFETADLDSETPVGLTGGCSHVRESGDWMREFNPSDLTRITLRTAFGKSCNGFFAKIGVNHLGLGVITEFARRYGWEGGVPADFHLDRSHFLPPLPQNSSTYTVGSFAAGFGKVGLSAAHAAFVMLTIANQGAVVPLRLFRDSPLPLDPEQRRHIYSASTAAKLNAILDASVKGGTASFAFRRGKYRKIQDLVGGKTGTLTGSSPKGLTTWFAGLAPKTAPEVVVAGVVLLQDHWRIKGPNLAAEGLYAYFDERLNQKAAKNVSLLPVAQAERKTTVK